MRYKIETIKTDNPEDKNYRIYYIHRIQNTYDLKMTYGPFFYKKTVDKMLKRLKINDKIAKLLHSNDGFSDEDLDDVFSILDRTVPNMGD